MLSISGAWGLCNVYLQSLIFFSVCLYVKQAIMLINLQDKIMENKIEKLSSKIYSTALMLSLVVALAAIMMLTFGGDRYLVLILKYAAWNFFPLCILFCYVFNAPIFVPLMDYFLDGNGSVFEYRISDV